MEIAILKNDSVNEYLKKDFSDYDRMVIDWIGPLDLDSDKYFPVYDMNALEKPALDHDLYISTGSKRSVYEDEDWIHHYQDIVLALHEKKRPHFGICFGHQMIALTLGAKVKKASGWGIGVHQWNVLNDAMKGVLGREELSLYTSHQDQVMEITSKMNLIFKSDFCPVAGFTVGRHIMTVQGHPEFSIQYMKALMEMRKSVYSDEVYFQGKASLRKPTGAASLLPVIKNFFFTS